MKTVFLAVILVFLLPQPCLLALDVGGTVDPGVRSITMENTDGRRVSIDAVRGKKGTLVVFSCNHCPWAKAWEGRIAAIGAEYVKKDVGVIMVNSNDPEEYPTDGISHMKKKKFAFPYVVDQGSKVAKAFGAKRTPEIFLLSPDNRVVYHGAVDDNSEDPAQVKKTYLRDALAALVSGRKIPVQETRSIGCSIKFY